MDKFKKYLFLYLMFFILFSLSCTLYYFDILGSSFFKVFKFIILMLLFMFQANFVFRDAPKYKFIFGLSPSIILIVLFLLVSLFSHKFKIKLLFYFLILICSSIFGIFITKNKGKS